MADKQGVLGTLTMDDLSKLRRMSRADAATFLTSHILSEDEMQRVKLLISKDRVEASVKQYDPTRRLWFAAAWLAGASWRQLSRLHDVAPQTIMSIVDRIMVSQERQSLRIHHSGMKLEALEMYHANFIKNLDVVKSMTPREVAQWLLDNTELDNE